MRYSANLGFLWADLPLPAAILAAANAGFAAVECHWPYAYDPSEVSDALQAAGLKMLCLNTAPADRFGLAAVTGRQAEARSGIDAALAYAAAIDCPAVHVMAGTKGDEAVFRENLVYACTQAAELGITILIEPINQMDVPEYHLSTLDAALNTLAAVACPNLKIMFDCYHIGRIHRDINACFTRAKPHIGHVQMANIPDRGPPNAQMMQTLVHLDWDGFIGAEYKPAAPDMNLGWMQGV